MIVQARQFKSMSALVRTIRKLGGLADRNFDLPMPSTSKAWFDRGGIPGSDNMAKAFLLILNPVDQYPFKGWLLAEKVANLLEDRHKACNDWACGFNSVSSVYLFFKPWGCSYQGSRVWFRPDPADMEKIRALDKRPPHTRDFSRELGRPHVR